MLGQERTPNQPNSNTEGKCELTGGFGWSVQIFLFVLVVAVVKSRHVLHIAKHAFESPKRKMVLFLLDGTKQLLSSGLLHITNICFSVILSGTTNKTDQCGIYLITFVVDISLGILICYYLLKTLDRFLTYRRSKVY